MLREIQQVLRLVMLMGKQRQQRSFQRKGGLLVLVWTDTRAPAHSVYCTVAAAGPWCAGIKMKALQPVLRDLNESMFPDVWPCPEPDPEELCAFTHAYGPLRLLLSFQMKDARVLNPEWQAHIEAFLHIFTLANAGIKTHLKFKYNQKTIQQEFRVKIKSKVAQPDEPSLILDVTCSTQPPECVKTGCWCLGGHPVLGDRLPLSIPPHIMAHGLFGELSIQPIILLRPCVLQYPNLATQLTHIQVFVYGPSNVPVPGPSTFLQNILTHLDCQELTSCGLRCSSFKDLALSGGTLYKMEENSEEESSLATVKQTLLLSLFLQHSDPFISQVSDLMATEALIERHLEDILSNSRQAVTTALQTELKKTLKAQNRRKKDQEKMSSAVDVILSSSISIVSSSSNLAFRQACLNSMKVHDTHELSASLCESLRRVTSWKFTPRGRCYSVQTGEHSEHDGTTRTEI